MTAYEKLTVANLRAELKERGIPSTGLTRKQQIIDKLSEDDITTAEPLVIDAPDAPSVVEDAPANGRDDAGAHAEDGAGTEAEMEAEAEAQGQENPMQDPQSPEQVAVEVAAQVEATGALEEPRLEDEETETGNHAPEGPNQFHASGLVSQSIATTDFDDRHHLSPINGAASATVISVEEPNPSEVVFNTASKPGTPVPTSEHAIHSTPTASRTPTVSEPRSPESTLNTQDVKEDTRRRKRRSLTPPLSTQEVAHKRIKLDDGPAIHLKEDEVAAQDGEALSEDREVAAGQRELDRGAVSTITLAETSDDVMEVTKGQQADEEGKQNTEGEATDRGVSPLGNAPDAEKEVPDASRPSRSPPVRATGSILKEHAPPESVSLESTIKQTQSVNNRYKELFAAPGHDAKGKIPPERSTSLDNGDERDVEPALHPATSAVYIRDFMRPLRPDQLKEHLIMLATPPDASSHPDILQEFYLDSIRTHCFASFNTVAAASRVRSGMHDRKWPDEANRKLLWADFIPEEKVKDWINVELDSNVGRGVGKRYEVVYAEAEDGMRASLQEESNAGPMRRNLTGPSGAPLGPRIIIPQPMRQSTGLAIGRPATKAQAPTASFLALDQLFKSTTAKPKLYYLPVAKDLAEKRLDELADRTARGAIGGGRSLDDRRRYTFEDGDVIVDAGPEFGYGRGGGGYRGGRGRPGPRGGFRGGRF